MTTLLWMLLPPTYLIVAYFSHSGRVLEDLLGLLVGSGLARIIGEELGNAALRRRRAGAGGIETQDASAGPGAA